ncbi:hypothetical protein BgiBS90_010890 [Biomphalaria glabrata]|nr:hypothetical protein BgiBS90_010890 [Biomphalaria glabrata]
MMYRNHALCQLVNQFELKLKHEIHEWRVSKASSKYHLQGYREDYRGHCTGKFPQRKQQHGKQRWTEVKLSTLKNFVYVGSVEYIGSVKNFVYVGSVKNFVYVGSVEYVGSVKNFVYVGSVKNFVYVGSVKNFVYVGSVENFVYVGSVKNFVYVGSVENFVYVGSA